MSCDCEGKLNYLDVMELLRKNLSIKIDRDGIDMEVNLYLDGKVISSDWTRLPGKDPRDD